MVVCRSKSGGAHCFLFTTVWISAEQMRDTLQHIAAALGYGASEIFPKQTPASWEGRPEIFSIFLITMLKRACGTGFLTQEKPQVLTSSLTFTRSMPRALNNSPPLVIEKDTDTPIKDGPPCLQILAREKISEGGRNSGLFNFGVYLRKAFPDSWENEFLTYNTRYLDPPLGLDEVNIIARQLNKKDYIYKCKDTPICNHCNAEVCKTRKFGIEAAVSGVVIANLRKYNSSPPVWFVDVGSRPLELETDALMNQAIFQKSCIEQLDFMPRSVKKDMWEMRINQLLQEMSEHDGSIVEISQDASIEGQFYDFLEDFCTTMQQAEVREELLLRRPWTDEEEQRTYFRLKDFEAFLRKNKFFEYKSHRIAQRLRDINGDATSLKIKGKAVRVWTIPAYELGSGSIAVPDMGQQEKAPF